MMKRFMFCIVLVCFVVSFACPAFAFEIEGIQFRNSLRLFHVESDSGDYDKQIVHVLKISKKGFPLWFYNKLQSNIDSDQPEKNSIRTDIGYAVNKNFDLIVERQEWDYKKSDEVVYRFGVGINF